MTKIPITITTINSPTKSVQKFSDLRGYKLYVSGDNKTPKSWLNKNSHYLSIEDQKRQFPRLHRLASENHYSRKNFAYLSAIKSIDTDRIFESDDDNIPNIYFPNDTDGEYLELDTISVGDKKCKVFNVFSLFTDVNVWPRGFPLSNLHSKIVYSIQKKSARILLEHSLANLDPDVDAIFRLTNGQKINFLPNKKVALDKGLYCPFNSQSTYWRKEIFPLLYLPSTVTSRVCDIWRGYIAQRVVWELGGNIVFLSPCVYQNRNKHNLMKDFNEELDLYLKVDKLIEVLDSTVLKGNVNDMIYAIYKQLVKNNLVHESEIEILETWLKFF